MEARSVLPSSSCRTGMVVPAAEVKLKGFSSLKGYAHKLKNWVAFLQLSAMWCATRKLYAYPSCLGAGARAQQFGHQMGSMPVVAAPGRIEFIGTSTVGAVLLAHRRESAQAAAGFPPEEPPPVSKGRLT